MAGLILTVKLTQDKEVERKNDRIKSCMYPKETACVIQCSSPPSEASCHATINNGYYITQAIIS